MHDTIWNRICKFLKNVWMYKINTLIAFMLLPFFCKQPLKNVIVFESHTNFDCNGGALYRYIIKKGLNKKYKIIWRIRNGIRYRDLPENVYTVPEDRPSLKKVIALLNAKYFFSDNTIPRKMRSGQISVYCTHGGCAIKNVKGLLVIRNDVDYIFSSSKNFDPIMCNNYSVPYPNKYMLHFGFPSNDILFNQSDVDLRKVTNRKFSKVLLWLPTFRNNKNGRKDSTVEYPFGVPLIQDEKQLIDIDKKLQFLDILLIVKFHPEHDELSCSSFPVLNNIISVDSKLMNERDINVYGLMSTADALISDYSSATYSFILKDKPIGFILEDYDSYKLGLIVEDYDRFIVGKYIYSIEDFEMFIDNVSNGVDEYRDKRRSLLEWLYEYRDGNACRRIVEFFKL